VGEGWGGGVRCFVRGAQAVTRRRVRERGADAAAASTFVTSGRRSPKETQKHEGQDACRNCFGVRMPQLLVPQGLLTRMGDTAGCTPRGTTVRIGGGDCTEMGKDVRARSVVYVGTASTFAWKCSTNHWSVQSTYEFHFGGASVLHVTNIT